MRQADRWAEICIYKLYKTSILRRLGMSGVTVAWAALHSALACQIRSTGASFNSSSKHKVVETHFNRLAKELQSTFEILTHIHTSTGHDGSQDRLEKVMGADGGFCYYDLGHVPVRSRNKSISTTFTSKPYQPHVIYRRHTVRV